jgi:hypothetical protein
MSEPELRRAVDSCVETLVQRGRAHLAQRVGAQLERLLREGRTSQALAVIGLFGPRTS